MFVSLWVSVHCATIICMYNIMLLANYHRGLFSGVLPPLQVALELVPTLGRDDSREDADVLSQIVPTGK